MYKKYIYIYEHKADFYFDKVPLHAAGFPLFFSQKEVFAEVVFIYVDQSLNRPNSANDSHST